MELRSSSLRNPALAAPTRARRRAFRLQPPVDPVSTSRAFPGRGSPSERRCGIDGAGEQVTVRGRGADLRRARRPRECRCGPRFALAQHGGERAQLGDLWIAVAMEDLIRRGFLAPARGGEQRVDQPGRVAGIARERLRPRWRDRFHPSRPRRRPSRPASPGWCVDLEGLDPRPAPRPVDARMEQLSLAPARLEGGALQRREVMEEQARLLWPALDQVARTFTSALVINRAPRPSAASSARGSAQARAPGESGWGRASGPAPTPSLGILRQLVPRRGPCARALHPAPRRVRQLDEVHSHRSTRYKSSDQQALRRGQREIVRGSSAGTRVSSVTSGRAPRRTIGITEPRAFTYR